ncbi:MAG: DNA translocase FtsK 4TM domain-containing protein [Pirellulales bacterium]|nr:DNA translocase FtsK 4TM domain-containing protein [Pirellulales bacterium]
MFENRNLRFDLLTLLLLAVTVLLAVALATYNPTDPPSTLVHPAPTEFHNGCGPIGAYIAHFLLESLGLGAYYLVLSLGVLSCTLLWRRGIDQPVLRAVGWAASLIAICTLATMALPRTTPGPVIGAGGYLGAMGQALLESNFASVGAYILALTVLLAGILLCTDYLILKFAAATTIVSGKGLMTLGHMGHARPRQRKERPATDLEDDDEELEDQYEYEDEEAEEDGEEDQYEYEDDPHDEENEEEEQAVPLKVRTPASKQEEAEAPASKPLKSKLASVLGMKNPQPKSESEREEIINQLEAADHHQGECDFDYELPPLDLLLESDDVSYEEHEREVRRKAKVLEKTFQNFGFHVKVVEIETGPVIAQYEIALEAGLRLAKITNLADDLAIALRVPSVRIVAPIPGKNTVGIEVPNENRQLVRMRDVIEETNGRAKRMKIPIYIGKDVSGKPLVVDLAALPHLLIAGRTGTGKSVCLNSIIVSMLMSRGPDEVRLLMIDPKMVELSGYRKLPHLMHPVVTDMRKAEAILAWAVDKMEERYSLLARAGVRHVSY